MMTSATARALQAVRAAARPGWRATVRTSFRRWPVLSGGTLLVMVLVSVLAPVAAPRDPYQHDFRNTKVPPAWTSEGSWDHILGTDTLGRDVLSRVIFGGRVSLMVAGIALASGTIIGTSLGLVAGYYGGLADEAITRLVDVWLGVPFVLVALVIAIILGSGITTIAILLAIFAWTTFVRNVRAEVLSLRTREYVLAAQVAGAGTGRVFVRHLLPGVLNTVLVIATWRVAILILVEALLSFLGAGIPPPTPAWGTMIAEGRDTLRDAWWISVFPGVAIMLTTVSLTFLGDWVRDFTDPRLRQLE